MRKTERILSRADKKGQAAMEFLMTYGWAILAAVIVVGVLWYLLGNPANYAGNQFQASAPLVSKGLVINTTGVTVNILNGAADSITVTNVSLAKNIGTATSCGWSGSKVVAVGEEGAFLIQCDIVLVTGNRVNSDVVFQYTEGSSTFQKSSTASISGKVP